MREDILEKIQNAQIQTEPYEHLIVDNFLPSDFYQKLASDLEAEHFTNFKYVKGEYGPRERFGVDITDFDAWESSKRVNGMPIPNWQIDVPYIRDEEERLKRKREWGTWKTSLRKKIHHHNYSSLPQESSLKVFFDLLMGNREELYSALHRKLETSKHEGDNYFFHASMVKDSLGYEIGKHTDSEENIFTILFYAPQTDINKECGLHIYKDANTEAGAKLLDFIPNRMVAFAPCEQGKDRPPTWHEVKRLTNNLVGTRNSFQMFFYKNYGEVSR